MAEFGQRLRRERFDVLVVLNDEDAGTGLQRSNMWLIRRPLRRLGRGDWQMEREGGAQRDLGAGTNIQSDTTCMEV